MKKFEVLDSLIVNQNLSAPNITPLARAIAVQTTAAVSGSAGISTSDNVNVNIATNGFTLHWEGSLPDWTPSANAHLVSKRQDASNYFLLSNLTTGFLSLTVVAGGVTLFSASSTVANTLTDGQTAKITVVVTRETALAAGSVVFYINGVQLGASVAITAAATATATNTGRFEVSGWNTARTACSLQASRLFNRALTAAEVLDLSINGVALADRGASNLVTYSSDFSAGVDGWAGNSGTTITGNQDGIDGEDDWLSVQRTGSTNVARITRTVSGLGAGKRARVSGVKIHNNNVSTRYVGVFITTTAGADSGNVADVFIELASGATGVIALTEKVKGQDDFTIAQVNSAGVVSAVGTGTQFYVKNIKIESIGLTSELLASNAQSNTGQILDSSGNKNHALLPASGATVVGRPVSQTREVRWTNTWAGTNELQYIGGVNQAILPANAYIESIIGTVSGATPHDIIIGDGSDTDRYVTITTGLAAGTTSFTLANRTTDGTNLKLTVDPDTNATMSIAWVIRFAVLEG